MPGIYRRRTNAVPNSRPRAFGPGCSYAPGSYAPAVPYTSEQAYGGDVVTYGHPGSLAIVGDPAMANYLPSEQIPSRWAPPVAGNQLRPVLTFPRAFIVHTPSSQPIHIPVPATAPDVNVSKTKDQLDARAMSFKGGPQGIATPTPVARPKFRLYGGGTT